MTFSMLVGEQPWRSPAGWSRRNLSLKGITEQERKKATATGSLNLEISKSSRPAQAGAVFVAMSSGSQWAASRCNGRGLGSRAARDQKNIPALSAALAHASRSSECARASVLVRHTVLLWICLYMSIWLESGALLLLSHGARACWSIDPEDHIKVQHCKARLGIRLQVMAYLSSMPANRVAPVVEQTAGASLLVLPIDHPASSTMMRYIPALDVQ